MRETVTWYEATVDSNVLIDPIDVSAFDRIEVSVEVENATSFGNMTLEIGKLPYDKKSYGGMEMLEDFSIGSQGNHWSSEHTNIGATIIGRLGDTGTDTSGDVTVRIHGVTNE